VKLILKRCQRTDDYQPDCISIQRLGGLKVTQRTFSNRCEYRILLEPGSDKRAPGGAVTVALCGHWDHDGPCRWPHHSTITSDLGGHHRLIIEFDAQEDEKDMVRAKIDTAVIHGQLTGPDGVVSTWLVER